MLKAQERKYCILEGKIVNRATKVAIPDNEPIFIFRGKDAKAVVALLAYKESCTDALHRRVIQDRVEDFQAFTETEEPDSDVSCLPEGEWTGY